MLVEKPMARTTAEARDLITAAGARVCVLMPGHTFIYSPAVQQGARADPRRRRGRRLLRHVLAHEPRQVPARRRALRSGAARPVDPPALAGRAVRSEVSATGCSVYRSDVAETAFLTLALRGAAPPPTSRSPGWRRARSARWSWSAASAWSSTTTPHPTSPCASTTAGWTSTAAGELRRVPAHVSHAARWSSRA